MSAGNRNSKTKGDGSLLENGSVNTFPGQLYLMTTAKDTHEITDYFTEQYINFEHLCFYKYFSN
jgi:hypothetical protein